MPCMRCMTSSAPSESSKTSSGSERVPCVNVQDGTCHNADEEIHTLPFLNFYCLFSAEYLCKFRSLLAAAQITCACNLPVMNSICNSAVEAL